LDLIDLVASRPFYQGRCVTVSPFAGLRSALIRQSMSVYLNEAATLFNGTALLGAAPSQPLVSHNHSNSWSIGPRVGASSYCLFPQGFRLEGDMAASLLYTRYTSVKHSETVASTAFNPGPYHVAYTDYSCVRPAAEFGLGLGWGRYFSNNDFHLDLSADYDFMIFWSQNMMRKLLDDTLTGTGPAPSDLFLHGLTATARFDF
jgi:hypothetical protein